MRILFLGSGAFGLPTLRALERSHQVVGVVSQPDKPAGRGKKPSPTPVSEWCAAHHASSIPLHLPANINETPVVDELHELGADAWVVIAYGQKLGGPLLKQDTPNPLFAINLHASRLPRWRGAAPFQWSILAGDDTVGSSVITMADRMDAGLVLAQSAIERDPATTAGQLHDQLAEGGPDLILSVLDRHAAGTLTPVEQDESLVTHARKLGATDRITDFDRPAHRVRDHIHGLNPWPAATTSINGKPIKLLRAEDAESGVTSAPGTILDPDAGLVACGVDAGGLPTALRLTEVQPAGKKPMSWADFARGARFAKGDVLASASVPEKQG